ncbi:MAG: hypothetical protein KDD70_11175 [Bdellovibrionales bacterium]|nr:hypothetical protein [Bdellovibrionales bacterium]
MKIRFLSYFLPLLLFPFDLFAQQILPMNEWVAITVSKEYGSPVGARSVQIFACGKLSTRSHSWSSQHSTGSSESDSRCREGLSFSSLSVPPEGLVLNVKLGDESEMYLRFREEAPKDHKGDVKRLLSLSDKDREKFRQQMHADREAYVSGLRTEVRDLFPEGFLKRDAAAFEEKQKLAELEEESRAVSESYAEDDPEVVRCKQVSESLGPATMAQSECARSHCAAGFDSGSPTPCDEHCMSEQQQLVEIGVTALEICGPLVPKQACKITGPVEVMCFSDEICDRFKRAKEKYCR